jgi:hypothetical protein
MVGGYRTAFVTKKRNCSMAGFLTIDEGLCVQIVHTGPFDDELASVTAMDKYLHENEYKRYQIHVYTMKSIFQISAESNP